MGVGVFEDDFNQTGGTFIVSPPLPGQEEYRQFLADLAAEFDIAINETPSGWVIEPADKTAPLRDELHKLSGRTFDSLASATEAASDEFDGNYMSFDTWQQDQDQDFQDSLSEALKDACHKLEMTLDQLDNGRLPRAGFDDEFVGIASARFIEVGWRGWETDHIIGVGVTKANEWQAQISEPDAFGNEIMLRTGRPPVQFADAVKAASAQFLEYIRLSLMEAKFECRYRTSGYTTGKYEAPADINEAKEKVRAQILASKDYLCSTVAKALPKLTSDERIAIVKAHQATVDSEGSVDFNAFKISVPLYCHDRQNIIWVDPFTKELIAETMASAFGLEIARLMAEAPNIEGLSAIPRNSDTEEYFTHRQNKELERGTYNGVNLVVTGEEFTAGANRALELRYHQTLANVQTLLLQGQNIAQGVSPANFADDLAAEAKELILRIRHSDYKDLVPGLECVISLSQPNLTDADKAALGRKLKEVIDADEPAIPVREILPAPGAAMNRANRPTPT